MAGTCLATVFYLLGVRVGSHSADMFSLVSTSIHNVEKRWLALTEATRPPNANSNSHLPSTAPSNALRIRARQFRRPGDHKRVGGKEGLARLWVPVLIT